MSADHDQSRDVLTQDLRDAERVIKFLEKQLLDSHRREMQLVERLIELKAGQAAPGQFQL